MKQGNHLTRKALNQDNARRRTHCPPAAALPTPKFVSSVVSWALWTFIAFGATVVGLTVLFGYLQ